MAERSAQVRADAEALRRTTARIAEGLAATEDNLAATLERLAASAPGHAPRLTDAAHHARRFAAELRARTPP
ncbi:hypothetical protein [Pseudonocardia acaciae]|uniref:hypothetical protein n=1 Tax=Pseudonocardia acaciae TaxID=551276 RepID=UPI0012ED3982|nr:hypothetical protein [Pseudonocardia acaciae]